jgi:NAD(P)-dependent dehydrogenase (short-subunit alcohol dehydrogenase family)
VVEDRWLRDKTPESLARVFETKANGAQILARKLRPEGLRFLVFFSSVSGRFGNAGQADYSAANEYLNKLADHLDREWPGRVVSVNWGPWESGMVSDGLRLAYAHRGIRLIEAEAGARALLTELGQVDSRVPEVILTCSPDRIAELASHTHDQ